VSKATSKQLPIASGTHSITAQWSGKGGVAANFCYFHRDIYSHGSGFISPGVPAGYSAGKSPDEGLRRKQHGGKLACPETARNVSGFATLIATFTQTIRQTWWPGRLPPTITVTDHPDL
jgi:hypothetical protein